MSPELRRVHILVVEDNPADVTLLTLALESAGVNCELTVLDDGAKALEFLRNLSQGVEKCPDLAIVDLNVPKHDGFEVLQAMSAGTRFPRIPIAVLSSSTSVRDQSRLSSDLVRRFITKPPDLEEFLKIGWVIKELVEEIDER